MVLYKFRGDLKVLILQKILAFLRFGVVNKTLCLKASSKWLVGWAINQKVFLRFHLEQKGQNRRCLGIFLWQPTSIIICWLDNLNLARVVRVVVLVIANRYGPNPMSFLIKPYELNLSCSSVME